tara:strand:+ start:7809 stop:8138 length:330 start_codon:yes stop_codon:yes gene_type:complete
MNWWNIIKAKGRKSGRKGKFVSKKWKKFATECIEAREGVEVIKWRLSKRSHLIAMCEYRGDDLPPKKKKVNFNVTVNFKKLGMNKSTCGGIKTRVRKELSKRKVYVGDW